MRTLAHVSDLHFGTEVPAVVEALVAELMLLKPDVVVVSGDLTQRARHHEFAAARVFLDRLPGPWIAVPGNHDVPLFDVLHRFTRPLSRFVEHISADPLPTYMTEDLVVVGATSARSLTISGGRLSREAAASLAARLEKASVGALRVLVCHHPVDPAGRRGYRGARTKHIALPELSSLGVDVVLSGHLHDPTASIEAGATTTVDGSARPILMIAAGTATSARVRGDAPNSFNVLRCERTQLVVERRDWAQSVGRFVQQSKRSFTRTSDAWVEQREP